MALSVDWSLSADCTELDESGRIGTGEKTLADWAVIVALTPQGDLLEDASFGANLSDELEAPNADPATVGAKLRGFIADDSRVEDVAIEGQTVNGTVTLPVTITPADEPDEFSGPLDAEMIERVITDWELEA